MPHSTQSILAPKTILQAISQVGLPHTTLQRLFGWHMGGSNRRQQSGRNYSYDIFNHTRRIATGRSPGQASSRQAAQIVGHAAGTFPRAAETISLKDEDLLNRRVVGGPMDELDAGGEAFITRQEIYLAERFANLVEFQTAAMLRGQYTFTQNGDDLMHAFSGGEITVDFQVPAGNGDQLDMLGEGDILDADWATETTDIPGHLHAIHAAMVQLTGMGLAHVVLTSTGWQQVVNNEVVQALGGTANVVFKEMTRTGSGEFQAVLTALPWITFHVVDYGLDIWDGTEESFTKLIEDDHAAFLPEPSPAWVEYLEGSEIVTEGPGGPRGEQFGFYPFAYPIHDPSGWELAAVFNGLPGLYTPKAVAYGLISGGSYPE